MNYNQTIATTTSYDPSGVVLGYTVKIAEYPFDLLVLMANIAIFLLTVYFFNHRNQKI